MKILQINAVNNISSTGRTSTELADYLNQHGHEGYIAWSDGPSYPKGYKIGSKIDVKMHGLLSRVFGTQAYFSAGSTKRLLSYMENLAPDIVHLRNLHGNYINLDMLLDWLAKNDIPTVLTLHDCWFYTGRCFHYTLSGCRQWQVACEKCPKNVPTNPNWFFDRSKQMFLDKRELFARIPRLAVVGVSDWITNEARKSFLGKARIVRRIYDWVDLDVFHPVNDSDLRRRIRLENKFVILGVASCWSNGKGLGKFIKLSRVVRKNMRIVLVGGMPGRGVNLPENVIWIGETANVGELAGYYSMADVLLNLSPEETFGKVTAEALACGTPVIVCNETANPELVGPGCGYTVAKEDINGFLGCINKIRCESKNSYLKSCVEFARNNFNMADRVKDYEQLYEEITARNREN